MEIKLNKSNNNPFYGMRNCLALLQNQGGNITESLLNPCWQEVKDDKTKRELFFSLLFSIGDITARQHNIFGKTKRDSGGNANREGFYTIFLWLKDNHKAQFIKFLRAGLFNEYTCFDILFRSRVQTKGCKVLKVSMTASQTLGIGSNSQSMCMLLSMGPTHSTSCSWLSSSLSQD